MDDSKSRSFYENFPAEQPTLSGFGDNFKILFKWTGSIYRLIWKEFSFYMVVYVTISLIHDFAMPPKFKPYYEEITAYCTSIVSSLQMVMLLAFFTSTSMQRWFTMVNTLPGTIKATSIFVHALKRNHPEGATASKQYARWILLSWTLVFRLVCPPLNEVFPDLMSLQNEGLLLDHERLQLEKEPPRIQPLTVIYWNIALVKICAQREMFIFIERDFHRNLDNLMLFKKSCNNTIKFATKNIPFALIQVASIAVCAFGFVSLFARPPAIKTNDGNWNFVTPLSITTSYIPIANVFQFFLYYSWLKFGRMASNPFGQDEDDINVKQLFYCHLEDALRIAEQYSEKSPEEELAMISFGASSQINTKDATEDRERKRAVFHGLLLAEKGF